AASGGQRRSLERLTIAGRYEHLAFAAVRRRSKHAAIDVGIDDPIRAPTDARHGPPRGLRDRRRHAASDADGLDCGTARVFTSRRGVDKRLPIWREGGVADGSEVWT